MPSGRVFTSNLRNKNTIFSGADVEMLCYSANNP